MTNAERASELRRLRGCLGSNTFRTNLRFRLETLGQIVPLLNFNSVYHTNALQFADTLSQEGFSSGMYENCQGRLRVLVEHETHEHKGDFKE